MRRLLAVAGFVLVVAGLVGIYPHVEGWLSLTSDAPTASGRIDLAFVGLTESNVCTDHTTAGTRDSNSGHPAGRSASSLGYTCLVVDPVHWDR